MINLQIPSLGRILAKLAPPLVRQPASKLVESSATFLAREAQTGVPSSGLGVAHSFSVKASGMSAKVSANWPGAMAMEFGRHPGTKAPPVSALTAWAARFGLEGLEYPIAQNIKRRGIKGLFFMRRAKAKLAGEFPHLLKVARAEIERRWVA